MNPRQRVTKNTNIALRKQKKFFLNSEFKLVGIQVQNGYIKMSESFTPS